MIRIDEIYQNVFLPTVKEKFGTGLHWFDPFGSTDINHLCNLPVVLDEHAKKRIIFWDQEPLHENTTTNFFDQFLKIYDNCPVTVVTSEKNSENAKRLSDTYGIKNTYYFFHAWAALDWYRGYNHSFLSIPFKNRKIDKVFLCLNNIIGGQRKHRILLLKELANRNLIDNNLISFPKICPFEKLSIIELCEKYRIDLNISDLKLPLVVDQENDHQLNSHKIQLWEQANQSLLQVVTETVYHGTRWHLTEKSFKPIVMQQPFVLVSCQGSLEYLRSYGFHTFSEFWDESYDESTDALRILKIGQLLEELCNLSHREKTQLQKHLTPVVEHNFNWFYSREFENMLWQELTSMIDSW